MTALVVLAVSAVPALAVHAYHKARLVTLGNDLADYQAARHAPAVVVPPAPEDGGIVPARDVFRTADRAQRKLRTVLRENERLRQVAYDALDRLTGNTTRPRRALPAPSRHRQSWRDRARWFRPWPQAAITEADR